MRAAMPAKTAEILKAVRELADKGFAAELEGGNAKQPLLFVDVYQQPDAAVAHVVYYGDDSPPALRLRLGDWLPNRDPVLHSPYLGEPRPLATSGERWIELPPELGRYAAIKLRQ